jgi:hypothetical protein
VPGGDDSTRELEPVESRHSHVGDADARLMSLDRRECGVSVLGCADDRETGRGELPGEAVDDRRMVVGDDDGDLGAIGCVHALVIGP